MIYKVSCNWAARVTRVLLSSDANTSMLFKFIMSGWVVHMSSYAMWYLPTFSWLLHSLTLALMLRNNDWLIQLLRPRFPLSVHQKPVVSCTDQWFIVRLVAVTVVVSVDSTYPTTSCSNTCRRLRHRYVCRYRRHWHPRPCNRCRCRSRTCSTSDPQLHNGMSRFSALRAL